MNTTEPFTHGNTLPPLSDEAAAQILKFLQQWIAEFESHYDRQLHRYYEDPTPNCQLELFPDSESPF